MKYQGNPNYKHSQPACIGVLVSNLGTPDAPTPAALRKYLAEFLSDPRVIEVPKPVWWCILHGIILRTRPKKSAEAYKKVWTKNGSPLLDTALKQRDGIQAAVNNKTELPVKVELAMRYGKPSIQTALQRLREANAQRLLLLPLYPQYAAATTASTFDAVSKELNQWRYLPEFRMINHYHDNAAYIAALANSIEQYWQANSKPEKLVFSFHGIPKHYFLAGDPYFCQCQKTARLVAESMNLNDDDWCVTFQSRFGPREWLKPYTDETLKKLAKKGTKSINVICPGFSADCLETIEEIDIQNRACFLDAGGEKFAYIPALNDSPNHIELLANLICQHLQGWQLNETNLAKAMQVGGH